MNLSTNEIANLVAEAYHTHCNSDPHKRLLEAIEYLDRNPDFASRILRPLKSAFPWLFKQAGTRNDFLDFCEREGIKVVVDEQITAGIYAQCRIGNDKEHFIFLNPEPKAATIEYIMFHEAAHYLFHNPSLYRIGGPDGQPAREVTRYDTEHRAKHIEAEIVASLCVSTARLTV